MQVNEVRAAANTSARNTKQQRTASKVVDTFDTGLRPTKRKSTSRKNTVVQASPALLKAGKKRVEQDRTSDAATLKDAGKVLGGLTASVVVGVLHQFQVRPSAAVERGVEKLGELTGALFVEFLSAQLQPDTLSAISDVVRTADGFGDRFTALFGVSPLEATRRFIDFISATEGDPGARLAGTLYA